LDGAAVPQPPVIGGFYGYSASWYEVPAMAADDSDCLTLAAPGGKQSQPALWRLPLAKGPLADTAARAAAGRSAGERRLREEYFRADFCEVPDAPRPKDLATLPANRWVQLTPAPRTPAQGCRQRDWSTAAWDSDRRQVVMWGGGHCVRSSSVPLHYSPVSNRIVEGYDADEPYCYNGWCGPGSSLLNRQWIDTHAYHLYAYDPKCGLLVTARGFLYDPGRMDWVRADPCALPFRYSWGSVVVASSPHGAVAWANATGGGPGLWLFDRDKGWVALPVEGKLFTPYCDSSGMVYDSKRDRMLVGGVDGGYNRVSNGTFLSYDFKSGALATVAPANPDPARTRNAREMVYVAHLDWVLIGDLLRVGDEKTGQFHTRIYDCAGNKMFLLEAGPVPAGVGAGWMYDAGSRVVYSFSYRGEAWGLRLDPATAQLLEAPVGVARAEAEGRR
jgi:hypothetical protein